MDAENLIASEEGRKPLAKELSVAKLLIANGDSVLFLKESPDQYNADILFQNEEWEIKVITSDKEGTIWRRIRQGLKQAPNLIFDIRKVNDKQKSISVLLKKFTLDNSFIKLKIIVDDDSILNFCK
jgi:hypothetical protein